MTSLGNIFLGQYQVHSETWDKKKKKSVAMLFRLSSKAFSRAVNGKKSHGFRYFLGMETALANDWCVTVQ